jgi:pSer/pThr/pTyr-binding forkhead associated (FHA) protein
MALVQLAKALLPVGLSQSLLTRGRSTFAKAYADTLLLLIRVDANADLRAGLLPTPEDGPSGAYLPKRHLEYQTEAHTPEMLRALLASAELSREQQIQTIADALSNGQHAAVELRKRPGADQISLERISLGRASNKDIVLRDASVSKFHAWFELFEDRDFGVADGGSTNLTRVNGSPLAPRQLVHLTPGDRLQFGSVSAVLCEAEALWSAVHP